MKTIKHPVIIVLAMVVILAIVIAGRLYLTNPRRWQKPSLDISNIAQASIEQGKDKDGTDSIIKAGDAEYTFYAQVDRSLEVDLGEVLYYILEKDFRHSYYYYLCTFENLPPEEWLILAGDNGNGDPSRPFTSDMQIYRKVGTTDIPEWIQNHIQQ